ncbi:DUF5753 domain-containing protein [Streptomyces sp. NPDC057654]|uniref:DUF5753 domain-containing protein n=1 Tax=Streptomyces sp. NPDC057654 TaxID=3346196 RepID=UPI00367B175A
MPPRGNPTARQGRLGAELRKMREAAGATAREAAALLGAGQTQISHIEAGRFGVSEDRLRRLAAFYACDDRRLVDSLVAMANERGRGWWEEYRGILAPKALDLAELEHHATGLRTMEIAHIPGLLQTEDHVRAAFAYVDPELPPSELDPRVEYRMRRQAVIDRAPPLPPLPYDVVIHEAALHIKVGGTAIARAQLAHLLTASERENVTVRVIPFAAEDFAGAGHSMLFVRGRVPQLDTVQLDAAHGSTFLDAEPQLKRYRARLDRVGCSALDPERSRELIRRIAQEM